MTAFERTLGSILATDRPIAVRSWLVAVGMGGGFYGAVMGGFGGFNADRALQIAYSAAKLPLLLTATTLLATPSFFVLNSLLGLRSDFGAAFRAVLGTQAAIAITLAALAPYTAVWYLSTTDYHEATVFNALMFAIASIAAQWQLRRRYRQLEAKNRRHASMRRIWVVLYAFVGIQMGWFLRPFVGDPGRAPTFLRNEAFGNAYAVVAETIWRALTRS